MIKYEEKYIWPGDAVAYLGKKKKHINKIHNTSTVMLSITSLLLQHTTVKNWWMFTVSESTSLNEPTKVFLCLFLEMAFI